MFFDKQCTESFSLHYDLWASVSSMTQDQMGTFPSLIIRSHKVKGTGGTHPTDRSALNKGDVPITQICHGDTSVSAPDLRQQMGTGLSRASCDTFMQVTGDYPLEYADCYSNASINKLHDRCFARKWFPPLR